LLADASGRRAVAASDVELLGAYRLRADSPLRDNPPTGTGETPPARRASHNGLILALAAPTEVAGTGGTQYWLRVRIVPRVQLRYPGTGVARINRISGQLRQRGFDVAPAEAVPTPVLKPLVTYYHEQDAAAAGALATRLEEFAGMPFQTQDRVGSGRLADPGTLEAWLDVDDPRSTASNRERDD
jgi:hypothetical protein